MSEVLIAQTRLVEKYKLAIPELEGILKLGGYCYIAGSLCLNIKDPHSDLNFTAIDIHPISETNSEIIQKAQYLASQIFVKHKKKTCFSYNQAVSNIKEYEETHGRELEPSGTVEIN